MRLISIGRAKSSTIRIDSEYVSAHHAELLLLDNGDIFITDCGSLQGTFVFGKRIEPGVEVPVRRGDKIEFDDVPLNWSRVPTIQIPDPATVKGVYGVGKSTRNRYQLSGDSVSRYHATFKEMKNGKWFIQDHSTNGTYINGQRIPADQDIRITSKDQIICGTVPCPNPVTSAPLPKILLTIACGVAACAVLFLGILALGNLFQGSLDPSRATVFIHQEFALKVVFADDPVKPLVKKDWYLSRDRYGDYTLTLGQEEALVMSNSGTGFFISPKGHILTNRHVTNWVWADKHYNNGSQSQTFRNYVELARIGIAEELSDVLSWTDDETMGLINRLIKSSFELEVVPLRFYIGYSGVNISSVTEMDLASLVEEASDERIDMALLQLNTRRIPKGERGVDAQYFKLNKSITDIDKLSRKDMYHTVGFPGGLALTKVVESNQIRSTSGQLHLVQDPGEYMLVFKGDQSVGGQSGSPIYDSRNRLIGVLWGGFTVTETTAACPIKHAQTLFSRFLQ